MKVHRIQKIHSIWHNPAKVPDILRCLSKTLQEVRHVASVEKLLKPNTRRETRNLDIEFLHETRGKLAAYLDEASNDRSAFTGFLDMFEQHLSEPVPGIDGGDKTIVEIAREACRGFKKSGEVFKLFKKALFSCIQQKSIFPIAGQDRAFLAALNLKSKRTKVKVVH